MSDRHDHQHDHDSHDHDSHEHGIERHCDVVIVDASAAGLAAALHLARLRRSVIVLDSGEHGGPDEHDEVGPEAVRSHGGEVLTAQARTVTRETDGRYRVALAGGHAIVARQLLSTGDDRGGAEVEAELADEEAHAQRRPSGNEADWDHRYSGEQLWSGNPNGTLVVEVSELPPGRALDVGAGEGGDALWLAGRGWQVTASDISGNVLARIADAAERLGVSVECRRADANADDAFEEGAYDLVSAQYASIPRTPDQRAVRNMLAAVTAGGVLLVVSHDLAPLREPLDPQHGSRPFDADAYVRVEDVVTALEKSPDWVIEVHEKRPRPPGAASAAHHMDDIVLRARRR